MKLGGAGGVAQLVVCLTNKHKMLGSDPQHHINCPWLHSYNPNPQEVGRSRRSRSPRLSSAICKLETSLGRLKPCSVRCLKPCSLKKKSIKMVFPTVSDSSELQPVFVLLCRLPPWTIRPSDYQSHIST